MPSARNAIQNALTRATLHQHWWINDPDCLLVRPDSDLSLAEVQSQATVIALTGGSLLLSDDLPSLPVERLRIAEQLVPLLGKRGRALDWFDAITPRLLRLDLENCTGQWHLIAVFNWEDEEQDLSLPLEKLSLPEKEYIVSEFWGRETSRVSEGVVTLMRIPTHGIKLLALREAHPDQACYLGSDLHISQGLEVTKWSEGPSRLELRLERPGKAQGLLDLKLPQPPVKISLNHTEIPWLTLGEDLYRIPVEFDQSADLVIAWE